MKKIAAVEADLIFPGDWFGDHTSEVVLVEDKVEVEAFEDDADEYVIFSKGLSSKSIDLSNDYHSIYAVSGEVEAETMILGDAVFVINGVLTVKDWLFLPQTNGIFQVNGEQFDNQNEAVFKHVICPVLVVFDRSVREFSIYKNINNEYEKVDPEELIEAVLDDEEIDGAKVLQHLQDQKSIFK
ncbi:hypothetical protein D3C87_94760 [compost metagenome]